MKLTYTIPGLTILEAAQLENYLLEAAFTFDITPYVDPASQPEAGEHEKAREKLSQAQVVDIYRTIRSDEGHGTRLKNSEYAERFSVAPTTISRIARGEHPEIPENVKKEVYGPNELKYYQGYFVDLCLATDKTATGILKISNPPFGPVVFTETEPQPEKTPDPDPAP